MSASFDPFAQVERFLQDELPLSDFAHWAKASAWRWESSEDDDVVEFVGRIEDRLYELETGMSSEEDIRRALASDAEIFCLRLRQADAAAVAAFLDNSMQRFLDDQLLFNDLLGRAEYVADVADERQSGWMTPAWHRIQDRAEQLATGLIALARVVDSPDAAVKKLVSGLMYRPIPASETSAVATLTYRKIIGPVGLLSDDRSEATLAGPLLFTRFIQMGGMPRPEGAYIRGSSTAITQHRRQVA